MSGKPLQICVRWGLITRADLFKFTNLGKRVCAIYLIMHDREKGPTSHHNAFWTMVAVSHLLRTAHPLSHQHPTSLPKSALSALRCIRWKSCKCNLTPTWFMKNPYEETEHWTTNKSYSFLHNRNRDLKTSTKVRQCRIDSFEFSKVNLNFQIFNSNLKRFKRWMFITV